MPEHDETDALETTYAQCDVVGCEAIANRIVTNPITDEILQLVCEKHYPSARRSKADRWGVEDKVVDGESK